MRQCVISLVVLFALAGALFAQDHFNSVPENGRPYAIVVDNATINGVGLEPGDEIGVFDGELCVGATVVDGWPNTLTGWEADPANGLPGYTAGREMIFYLWDASEDFEIQAESETVRGNGNFGFGAYSQVILTAGEAPPEDPVMVLSTGLIDFGEVLVDQELVINFNVANDGEAVLIFSATLDDPGFSIDNYVDVEVAPGDNVDIPVTFAPVDEIQYVGMVDIVCNDPDFPGGAFVELNGIGIPDVGGPHFTSVPENGRPYSIVIDEALVEGVLLDDPEDEVAVFDGDLCVGAGFVSNWPMPLTAWEADPANGLPGYTAGHDITFMMWDASTETEYVAESEFIRGNGTYGFGAYSQVNIWWGLAPPEDPEISVSPADINFGENLVDSHAMMELTVSNIGLGDLDITDMTIAGDPVFTIGDFTGIIAPGNNVIVEVNYDPVEVGDFTAEISILSNDPTTPEVLVPVYGSAYEEQVFPNITVNPWDVNFGEVLVNTHEMREVNLGNNGEAQLEIISMTLNGDDEFSIDPFTGFIEAGTDLNFEVYFDPTTVGQFAATVTIISNDPDSPEVFVQLAGNGFEEQGGPHFESVPENGRPYSIIASSVLIDGELLIDPEDEIGIFDGDLCVGAGFITDMPVPLTAWEADPANGLPGYTAGHEITFMLWDASTETEYIAESEFVRGNGTFGFGAYSQVNLWAGDVPVFPNIEVDPLAMDFGDVLVRTQESLPFTISNTGDADLEIFATNLEGDPAFTIDGFVGIITPGNDETFNVYFEPGTVDQFANTLTVVSNDPDNPEIEVPLTGNGIPVPVPDIAVDPVSIDFGAIAVGETVDEEFTVTNNGNADLEIFSISIAGDEVFSVNDFAGMIAPGNSETFAVEFSPVDAVDYAADVEIISDDPDVGVTIVSLAGSGFIGDHFTAVEPTGIPYAVLVSGATIDMIDIEPGDEIGIFDQDLCVGAGVFEGEFAFPMTAWGGDPANGLPGYVAGNEMFFMIWDASTETEYVAIPEYIDGHGDGTFGFGPFAEVVLQAGEIPTYPDIDLSTFEFDFGEVYVGSTSTEDLLVANIGENDLVFSAEVIGDGYSIPETINVLVLPGEDVTIPVTFEPLDVIGYQTQIVITSNSPGEEELFVDLYGLGIPVPVPDIELSDDELEFGDVAVNNELPLSLTIFNNGDADLTISATNIIGDAAFSTLGFIGTITPGANEVLEVVFAPDSDIDYNAVLEITSNDPDSPVLSVDLSGTGYYGPHFDPVDQTGRPYAILIDEAVIGGELLETGDQIGVFDGDLCVGAAFVGDEWPVVVTAWQSDPEQMLPGFTPGNEISYVMYDFSNDADVPAYTLYSFGNGTFGFGPYCQLVLADVPVGSAIIELSTDDMDFGTRRVNTTTNMPFTISNNGNLPLVLGEAVVEGDGFFAPDLNGVVIEPNGSENFLVGFVPAEVMPYEAVLHIPSNDLENPVVDIALEGQGASPDIMLSADSYDFGQVELGNEILWDLEIANIGNWDLTIDEASISGDGFSGRPIVDLVINPEGTAVLTVAFLPVEPILYNGAVTIESDDPDMGEIIVELTGMGTSPNIVISEQGHDFGGLLVGTDATWDLEISNTGNIDLVVFFAAVMGEGFTGNELIEAVIPPEGTEVISVTFAPMAAMLYEGMIGIQSNDPDQPEIMVPLFGHGLAQDIDVPVAEHDFGGILINTESIFDLNVANIGSWDLTIESIIVEGEGFSAPEFADVVIAPEGVEMLPITFLPTEPIMYAGTVTILSDDPNDPEITILLTGHGLAPDINLSDEMVDFGDVEIYSATSWDVEIVNDGNMDLMIYGASIAGDAAISGEVLVDLVIEPRGSYTYTVNFQPTEEMAYNAELTILSNDPFDPEIVVPISGVGYYDYFFNCVPPTGLAYAVLIEAAMLDGEDLEEFDEVGIFDGDLCVGVALVTGEWPLAAVAWQADLAQGLEGYTRGHRMEYRLYSTIDQEEYDAEADYSFGTGIFGVGPFAAVSVYGSRLQYFETVMPTGLPYAVVVERADVEEVPLTRGDEIAVFDGDLCVGAMRVNGEWPLAINVWQNDPVNHLPGFIPGNEMTFNFWTEADNKLHPVVPIFNEGNGTFGYGPYSSVELDAVLRVLLHQDIGRNRFELVSMNLIPEDMSAESVFSSIEMLRIVMNDAGNIFAPQYHVNTIGDVQIPEGYRLFASANTSWDVEGLPLDENPVYHLTANRWNYLGFPFTHAVDVEEALASIRDVVLIVQSDDARMWVPRYHVNTMGDMLPGEGYQIIVTEDVDLVYNGAAILANAPVSNSEILELPEVEGAPESTGLPYWVMTEFSDELMSYEPATIEIFDGTTLVGKGLVLEDEDLTPVVTWGGAPDYNVSGFAEGNEMGIVLRSADGTKIPVIIDGEGARFGEGGFANVNLSEVPLPKEFAVEAAYPNPFNPSVSVPFAMPAAGNVSFTVYNVLGQQVYSMNRQYEAGYHRFMFDAGQSGKSLVSGVYFLQVQNANQVKTQKLLLLK